MSISDIIQTALFLLAMIIITPLLGRYMARVFLDENHVLKSIVNPFEKTIYRLISCKKEEEDE
jgi:K+-transporting ATPase ATPase A chain